MRVTCVIASLAVASLAGSAQAAFFTFGPFPIEGTQEVPANASPAFGTATVTIDTDTGAWSLDLEFSGLTAPVSVAHIHRAAPGVNGSVIVGLDGIALSGGRPSWSLITPGSTSLDTGGPLVAPFVFPAAEIPFLVAGETYINIHSSNFPGGEIRGQIVPTPGALAVGAVGALVALRRRR